MCLALQNKTDKERVQVKTQTVVGSRHVCVPNCLSNKQPGSVNGVHTKLVLN